VAARPPLPLGGVTRTGGATAARRLLLLAIVILGVLLLHGGQPEQPGGLHIAVTVASATDAVSHVALQRPVDAITATPQNQHPLPASDHADSVACLAVAALLILWGRRGWLGVFAATRLGRPVEHGGPRFVPRPPRRPALVSLSVLRL